MARITFVTTAAPDLVRPPAYEERNESVLDGDGEDYLLLTGR